MMEYPFGKINILFIMMQMEMGGSEHLIYNLVRNIDRKLFNPSIAWFFGDKILEDFNNLRVPLYHVPKIKRFDFGTMRKLGKIIKDNEIHIVNAHHFMSMVYAFYGCKIKNNVKLIYTEHSKWEIEKSTWKWRRVGSYMLSRSEGAVGVSESVSKHMHNIFKTNSYKTFTIQNGVDIEAFSKSDNKTLLRKKLNLTIDEKVIGMVANFKKIKNHIFLLKAFDEIVKNYKNAKLLLIGQGFEDDAENSEKEIQDLIADKGLANNVLLLGFRSDITDLLSIMDIFCLTSFKEGLPISLIEAMAAGLPVVGTDVEGIRDVIVPNKNGFLVQVDDVKGLKNVLLSLLQNSSLRDKMGQESKALATRTYSLDRCISQYQDLFISIMNK